MSKESEKRGIKVLKAISSPVRLKILNILYDRGSLSYTELMSLLKMEPARDAGRFAYHLKFLLKTDLIEVDSESKKYRLTDRGRFVIEFAEYLERKTLQAQKLLVRTSKYSIEEFDVNKIVTSLRREAEMPLELAQKIAKEAEKRLLKSRTRYVTAPLIREVVNAILIESGLEDYRHKLTRLGLPVYDVHNLLMKQGLKAFNEAGKIVLEEYALLNLLPRDISDAHLAGDLHIHDLGYWTIKPSEVIHDLRPFLKYGLNLENLDFFRHSIHPPKSFEAALNLIANVASYSAEEVAQGQTLEFFNVFLAPFITNLTIEEIRETLKFFILNLTRYPGISISLELCIPSFISEQQISTSFIEGRKGIYGNYSEESLLLASMVIDVFEEIGKNKPLLNPSIIVKLRPECFSNSHTRDLLLRIHQLAIGKASIYFANLLDAGDSHKVFSTFGCMLKPDLSGDWEVETLRTSILGAVTINLPRIAYECEGDLKKFQQILMHRLEMAIRALEIKHRWFKSREKTLLPFLIHKIDGDQYLRLDVSRTLVNVAGLTETAEFLFGKKPWEDENALSFTAEVSKQILNFIKTYTRDWRFSPSCLPLPKAPSRLAKLDIERFGLSKVKFQGIRRNPYYSTFSRVSLVDNTKFKMLAAYAEITKPMHGGALMAISPEGLTCELDELFSTTRKVAEVYKVPFFTYDWKVTYCRNCMKGWLQQLNKCPHCGSINPLVSFTRY
ncbi:MAG: anaerobic ribonucleoside-triphosphate reductase [Candidatus Bathyarchaeia archaeon]